MSRPRGPLVAAICPTLPSRSWCRDLALAALGVQTGIELGQVVIGMDYGDPWGGAPVDCAVRLERYDSARLTLGEKRQQLCDVVRADADWITFWDDDDWKAPDYLAKAVSGCIQTDCDLGGVSEALFVDLCADQVYRYRGELVGTSLVVHRKMFGRAQFQARDRGEDAMFVRACRSQGARVADLSSVTGPVVAFQHGQRTGNATWPPTVPEFELTDHGAVTALMGEGELVRWQAAYRGSGTSGGWAQNHR